MKRKLTNEKGFTLLEILVAVTLLAVALLGMAGLTAALVQGNDFSSRVTTASTLAQDKMEQVTKLGYGNTAAVDTTVTEGYNTIPNFPYYKRVTFTDVDSPSAGMKTVTVTVFWAGDTHSVAPQTILTQ
ncbi:MAG TPA: prepilin-type N-terminal cleavage/methylation domain-containing protein [Candidatus Binatia bacterium]